MTRPDQPHSGSKTMANTVPAAPPSPDDGPLRRVTADQLLAHLARGAALSARCEALARAPRGEWLGPMNAAARLMRADAKIVAGALARLGQARPLHRVIVERAQNRNPQASPPLEPATTRSTRPTDQPPCRPRAARSARLSTTIAQLVQAFDRNVGGLNAKISLPPPSPPKKSKGGAPFGNRNALKHGGRTRARHAFLAEVRAYIREGRALLAPPHNCNAGEAIPPNDAQETILRAAPPR
jgi:hypothetical protein